MKSLEVTPYLYKDTICIPVYIDGAEVFEGEMKLAFLVRQFIECLDPRRAEDEIELYDLLFAFENGIEKLTDALGADEEDFESE